MAIADSSPGGVIACYLNRTGKGRIGILIFVLSIDDCLCKFFADSREVLDKGGDYIPFPTITDLDSDLIL